MLRRLRRRRHANPAYCTRVCTYDVSLKSLGHISSVAPHQRTRGPPMTAPIEPSTLVGRTVVDPDGDLYDETTGSRDQ